MKKSAKTKNQQGKNDKAVQELLALIKAHPELIHAIMFNPVTVKRLLKSPEARRLVLGKEAKEFLENLVETKVGPVGVCGGGTFVFLGTGGCRTGTA